MTLKRTSTPTTDLLVLGRQVFQVSGRPSPKDLASRLAKRAQRPVRCSRDGAPPFGLSDP